MNKKQLRNVLCLLFVIILFINLFACANKVEPFENPLKPTVNIVAFKGPTGIGILKIMEDSSTNLSNNNYNISIATEPSEAAAKLVNKDVDVAFLPTNMASILYNKTMYDTCVVAVNTLGNLYLLSSDSSIDKISDLGGKTVYISGQGASPEYIFKYLLKQNNLNEEVTVEYKSEHAELAAQMVAGNVQFAVLPEPFVTQVISKNSDVKVAVSLNDEWVNVEKNGTSLAMGCIVVRKDFIKNNRDVLNVFLDEYKASCEYAIQNVEQTASLSDKYGIMQKEVARVAIPKCNLTFLHGEEMKRQVSAYLGVLFAAEPKSVGGKLPNEDFYYKK